MSLCKMLTFEIYQIRVDLFLQNSLFDLPKYEIMSKSLETLMKSLICNQRLEMICQKENRKKLNIHGNGLSSSVG